MSTPPSTRFQLWSQMVFVCASIWVMSCSLLIPIIWEIGNTTLGPFYLHTDLLVNTSWQEYWELIKLENEQRQFYLRALLPSVALLILSMLITRKLLWVSGGREMARHIKGPILLKGEDAIHHANTMRKSEVKS